MWSHFEGKARTRDESAQRIHDLTWSDWHPQGITLHNTAMPTLKMWAESGPSHDARIRNLESYYEDNLGWHAGPHWFVSRNWINWFSNPLERGVHSRCWNATRFGIEMVGDYNAEPFNTGDGAMVRDNAVFLMAVLNRKFGFKPDDLTFHVECKRDNHDCPGKNVNKRDVIQRVTAAMAVLAAGGKPVEVHAETPAPSSPPPTQGKSGLPPPSPGKRQTGITMTEFAGPNDHASDRVNGYTGRQIDWRSPGVALPYHFPNPVLPKVRVWYGQKSVICPIVDIGPWTSHVGMDPYWIQGARPKAETHKGTNGAGIDGTWGTFEALGIPGAGKVKVDWEFIA